MAPEALPGHRGNLTADQEEKLRQLWASLLKLSGVEEGKVDKDKIAEAAAATEEKAPATESATPKKKRFGLFGKKHDDSSSGKDDTATDSSGKEESENDKYGQTQVFKDALAKQKPEDIRDGIWSMVKCDHPDGLALRFLRARKWDVEKALVMLISAMNWRVSDMHVDDEVMKRGEAGMLQFEKEGKGGEKKMGEGFMAQARMGKSYLHGTDRQGRPISVVRVRLHKQSDQTEESLEKWTVYIIETTRLALQPPVDTGTIIFDMTDFGLSNMDYASVKFMAKCFEANYPECLGAVLCHNAPWVFQGIWKIIRGWLDPVVVSKIHFTNGRAGLEEFIEPKHIVKELGGDEDWEYQYVEPIDGENDKMKDTETRDRLIAERDEIAKEFEASTLTWIRSPDSDEGKAAKAKRDQLGDKFKDSYWQLDPYVRARSMYDRLGQLQADGKVDWYKKAPSAVTGQSTDKATGQGSTTAEGDKESEVD